jgi:pSer/pThr/pTyr-binding forkhead associated (FHA) protein
MNAPYFVEILARNGDVLHRHQVNSLPIRLGRGYDNDFIIDDAHAAASHAVIESDADGGLQLRDLGTQNGVVSKGKRHLLLPLTGDTVVRIGHTNVRVRGADFPVAPELVDRTMHSWEGLLPGVIGMIMTALFAISTLWINDTQSFQPVRYLQSIAIGMAAALVWSGVWAFGNRLFGRHARLGRHLFIVGCAATALNIFKLVSSLLAYAFSLEWITRYGSHAAIAIVCGMLFYHLCTVKPHHVRRFAVACLAMLVLGSGLILLSNEQRSGRTADDLYMALLLPPAVKVAKDHSVDEFMGDVGKLKPGLDVERAKKVKDDEETDD